jgi:hypothetical protein
MTTWKTTGIWDPLPTQEQNAQIRRKINEMYLAGKTTQVQGTTSPSPNGLVDNVAPMTMERNWPTLEAAQEWVDFIDSISSATYTITENT